MIAHTKTPFRIERPAIYLMNNTIYTRVPSLLRDIPAHVPVFVDETLLTRYAQVIQSRLHYVVTEDNHTVVQIFEDLVQNHKPVVAMFDVNQAAFQWVTRVGFLQNVEVIPVFAHESRAFMTESIVGSTWTETLNRLQLFLLESYLGRSSDSSVQLFDELVAAANYYGLDRVICKDLMGKATYKDILLGAYVLSGRIRKALGERSHARVGVFLPNSIGNVVTLFSLFYLGKSPVMLNYSAGLQTLVDACETSGLQTILTSREFIEKGQLDAVASGLGARFELIYLEDLRKTITLGQKLTGLLRFKRKARGPKGAHEIVLFTSGSEYLPRGVVLSHDNIYANTQQTRSIIDFGTEDRMLNAMPMFHSFGLTAGALLPLISGIQTYLYPSPLHYKRIPEIAGEEASTILFGTSSFLEKYGQNATPHDFRSLRYAVVGAERLKREVEKDWLDKFQLQIMQGYGATETSPIMCLDTPINHAENSVGRFLPGIRYRLEPVEGIQKGGKLYVQGPNVMKGYLVHGTGFVEQDGWYDTGDVVDVDEEGYVTIIGRLKRFAKIAGEMVSLNLVEQLASQVYGSTDFAAVNVPDEIRGERIILATTVSGQTLAPFQAHVAKQGYSRLHVPSELMVIDAFPLLGSGKTDYVSLKQQVTEAKEFN